jgi:hypothetical protein
MKQRRSRPVGYAKRGALVLSLAVVLVALACAQRHEAPAAESLPSAAPASPAPASSAPGASTEALPHSLRPAVDTMDAATALRALDEATRLLDDTLGAGAPDCGAVKLLRDRICELSARICRIAGESAPNPELAAHCADAKPRCERAKSKVAGPCG